mgnify:FL=1
MKMIGAYEPLTPLQTAGSGSARWCIARRGTRRFFLKEFLSPVYPAENTNAVLREKQMARCRRFEEKKRRLYSAMSCVIGDTLVPVTDFFRFGLHYYAVSEEIPEPRLTGESSVETLSREEKREILLSLALCLQRLHLQGIVHADLKPEHVLLRKGALGYEARLIDLDSGFLTEEPPAPGGETEGDPVYLAPEAFLRMTGEAAAIGPAIDTFAFGAILHRLWTGALPETDAPYLYEAALEQRPIRISAQLPPAYGRAVRRMLDAEPSHRPSDGELVRLFAQPFEKDEKPPLTGEALNGLSRFFRGIE